MPRNLALTGCALLAAGLLAGCQESRSYTQPYPQSYQTHPSIQQQPANPQPGIPQQSSPQQFSPQETSPQQFGPPGAGESSPLPRGSSSR